LAQFGLSSFTNIGGVLLCAAVDLAFRTIK